MREVGPISDVAPEFPLAAGALAPLRAKAEAQGSGAARALRTGPPVAATTVGRDGMGGGARGAALSVRTRGGGVPPGERRPRVARLPGRALASPPANPAARRVRR